MFRNYGLPRQAPGQPFVFFFFPSKVLYCKEANWNEHFFPILSLKSITTISCYLNWQRMTTNSENDRHLMTPCHGSVNQWPQEDLSMPGSHVVYLHWHYQHHQMCCSAWKNSLQWILWRYQVSPSVRQSLQLSLWICQTWYFEIHDMPWRWPAWYLESR